MFRRFMFCVIALLLLVPNHTHAASTRIVGGTEAVPGSWPFMAAIMDEDGSQYCGGSLIAAKWVVSAAHCFSGNSGVTPASQVRVGLGIHKLSVGGSMHTVKRVIVHPSYDDRTSDFDIALLELNTAAVQAPISVNTGSAALTNLMSTAIGWGLTNPNNNNSGPDALRQVDVPVVSNTVCNSVYGGGITANMICAGYAQGGKDACQGDSGGPLVATVNGQLRLVGITSFGNGCADPNSYGVYSRVSQFESFISQYVAVSPPAPGPSPTPTPTPAPAPVPANGKFGLWNGFLAMTNIVELVNRSQQGVTAQVNMHASSGALISTSYFYVAPGAQTDVIVNQLNGFSADSYGLLQVSNNIEGRVVFYRAADPAASAFEYVFAVSLANASTGATSVGFNTFQPSTNPADRENVVSNWLSIVNLASASKSFTIRKYDEAGALLSESTVSVGAKSRSDFEGGHVVPGPSRVGLVHILPADSAAPYLAQLIRYGAAARNSFDFAFPLGAGSGSTQTMTVPLGSRFVVQNWLELINVGDSANAIAVDFYSSSGANLGRQSFQLSAKAQYHIYVNAILGDQQIGYARIASQSGLPVNAESMFYFRDLKDGSITSMYGSQAVVAGQGTASGSFNLFLGMENYLKLSNPSDQAVSVDVTIISGASAGSSRTLSLPANSSRELLLHDTSTYGTSVNSYGTVTIAPASSSIRVLREVLRMKREPDGLVQFAAPTTFEQ